MLVWIKIAGEGFWKVFGERLGRQAADEFIVLAPRVAEVIVRIGARLFLPRSHRQRYTSEWLAHLGDFHRENKSAFATIGCAIGIVFRGATGTIAPRVPGSAELIPQKRAIQLLTVVKGSEQPLEQPLTPANKKNLLMA